MSPYLEDDFNDIIGKAIQGHNLSLPQLAKMSGVPLLSLKDMLNGQFNEDDVRRVAPILELRGDALCNIAKHVWLPKVHKIPGLWQILSFYGSMEVNTYLVQVPDTSKAILFDTGASAEPIITRLKQSSLTLSAIFITHTHSDHIAALDCINVPIVYAPIKEPVPGATLLKHRENLSFSSLTVEARLTPGHSAGSMTYVLKGLTKGLVAIVGDALFAGSMGRGFHSYEEALRSNRQEILSLPPATILCPGHGPMTSVAEELECNPFF